MLIPLGQTIVHLPHSMQHESILRTSCPLSRARSTFLRLMPLKGAAVQLALQEPQAMQLRASGSIAQILSISPVSALSRSRAELRHSENPKSVIAT